MIYYDFNFAAPITESRANIMLWIQPIFSDGEIVARQYRQCFLRPEVIKSHGEEGKK